MKLHANARTCPNSRRLIVRRIEEEGWSLAAAAEAAGVSERTAAKWLGRWRAEGEAGLLDRSSAPSRRPTQLPGRPRAGDRGAEKAADDRRRDRRVPGDGALDRLAVAASGSASASARASSRPSPRTATSESARASSSTSTSKSSGGSGGAGPPRDRQTATTRPGRTDQAGRQRRGPCWPTRASPWRVALTPHTCMA